MKLALAASFFVASASAFAPVARPVSSTALYNGPVIGKGGMADTRDPDAVVHEDARKSISEAPSFEEYMKQRAGGAAPAPAPAAAAPAPAPAYGAPAAAPAATGGGGGGSVVDTLSSLQGPGVVWGAEGVTQGHEESDLKGYDNFDSTCFDEERLLFPFRCAHFYSHHLCIVVLM